METKERPLISIIIPIYKAEKYLEKCVNCIRNQTYQNLEIILVEDGSPDKSGAICDAFAAQDSRIKVIHKENGGAATARNAGLDVMTGDYVSFVDADDYMELNYIETLYQTLADNQAQVAICGFKTVDEEGNAISIDELHDEAQEKAVENRTAGETAGGAQGATTSEKHPAQIFTGNDIILQDLRGHWEHVAPWGKLTEAELYKNVRYPKWIAYEDEPVFIQVFDKVERVAVSTERLYYYVQHQGSLMNSAYSEKARRTTLNMWKERIQYYSDELPRHKELYNCILQAFVAWNVLYLSLHAHEMTKEQEKELKQEIRRYFTCLFHTPHLFSSSYSIKLAVKCVLTLINTNILRKRYVQ